MGGGGGGAIPPKCTDRKNCNLYARASEASEHLIFRSQNKSAYIITLNAVIPFITYGMAPYTKTEWQNTKIEENYMNMWASRASELRKCCHLYILNVVFLPILCRYFRYFVGTNDMYRQTSKCADKTSKMHYWGGGIPPPPPLATLLI